MRISTDEFPPGSEIVTLTARHESGLEVSTRIVVEAYPVDDSYGKEAPSTLRLAVVPNPIQSAFVNIYAISEGGMHREPLLRVKDGGWQDLALAYQSPGIWQASFTRPRFNEGDFDILGLTIDTEDEVIKSSMTLSVNVDAEPISVAGKAVVAPLALRRDADALYRSYIGEN